MSESGEGIQPVKQEVDKETPFRWVQNGKIYDKIEPHKRVNIAALSKIYLEIDEENLDLKKVSTENLEKGWGRHRENFTKVLIERGIDLDPFTVYKYYLIQRKAFQILGKPFGKAGERDRRFRELGFDIKLSQTKGFAMCSEYALLSCYMAQKIGEPAHLVIGTAIADDKEQWREAHAYVWVDGLNVVFDSVKAQSEDELPALMIPTAPLTLKTLEEGKDFSAKRVGTDLIAHYGLEASGFGLNLAHSDIETPERQLSEE